MAKISELLPRSAIVLDLQSKEKFEVISELVRPLLATGAITDEAEFVSAIVRRENMESTGIGRLRSRLARTLRAGSGPRLAVNRRQLEALSACRDALRRARLARTLETAALEVRSAIDMLNQVDAPATSTDILDRVFARFCVGK